MDMLQSHHLSKVSRIPFGCVLLLCLLVVSCSRDSWLKFYGYDRASLLKKNIPQEDEALARDCVDLLLQNRLDELESRLDLNVKNADMREKLVEMSSYFPSKPLSVKTVEGGVVHGRDFSTTAITLEYQFQGSWLLANLVIQTKAGVKTITTFGVTPTAERYEEVNEFTLADKGFSQSAGLLLTLSVVALTLYAFVLCVRMELGKKKWIWLVAIVVGVCRLTVNWTTGEWFFTPLALNIPPVQAWSSAYGPWMLQICSPVGAIAFLQLRKRLALEALPLSMGPDAAPPSESSVKD